MHQIGGVLCVANRIKVAGVKGCPGVVRMTWQCEHDSRNVSTIELGSPWKTNWEKRRRIRWGQREDDLATSRAGAG